MTQAQKTYSLKECIDNCLECHRTCLETLQYCLKKGGRHAEATHITLLQSCALICNTSAQFMIAGSELHQSTCSACADVCSACADDCDQFSGDDQMKHCAEVCRRCADFCRQMSSSRQAA